MDIHQLVNLSRPLIVFDTETTGVDTQHDRIVELGFQQYTSAGIQKEWRSLINPEIPIPPEVSAVHHVYDRDVQGCRACGGDRPARLTDRPCRCETFRPWPTFAQLANNLTIGFTGCDFAGKNVRFDLRIFGSEMQRAHVNWSVQGARIIDAERLESLGEPRSLSDLYKKHTGQTLDGAHGALTDVRASATVICAQLEKYTILPRSIDALHEMQFPGMIDLEGKFKFINGVATCCFGKWNGKPIQSIEPSYFDWILKNDFSDDLKALARSAKLGVYPEYPSGQRVNAREDRE